MLACVLFVQKWRIEFELKREVGWVVGCGGMFRRRRKKMGYSVTLHSATHTPQPTISHHPHVPPPHHRH